MHSNAPGETLRGLLLLLNADDYWGAQAVDWVAALDTLIAAGGSLDRRARCIQYAARCAAAAAHYARAANPAYFNDDDERE